MLNLFQHLATRFNEILKQAIVLKR